MKFVEMDAGSRMRTSATIPLTLAACLLAVACHAGQPPDDAAILAQVLHNPNTNGDFTVVAPLTTLSMIASTPEELANTRKYVRENLNAPTEQIDRLLAILIRKNEKPVRLELSSSRENGYVVDDDGKFDDYFKDEGGGWKRWYKENPRARGYTSVSLPAHDPVSDLILVYKGTQSDWLSGAGYLILYKYVDGRLEELGRVELWVS